MISDNNKLVKILSTLHTALITPQDEFAGFTSGQAVNPLGDKMNEIMSRRRAEAQEAATEAAAVEVLALIEVSDNTILNSRQVIADLRRSVGVHTAKIEAIAVAREYGKRSMNWLPLAAALGKVSLSGPNPEFEVPADEFKTILAEIKATRAAEGHKAAMAKEETGAPAVKKTAPVVGRTTRRNTDRGATKA